MWVGGQRHASAALPPGKRYGTHFIGGCVSPRAGLDGCEKSLLPPGIDPRTVHPVASPYTDWAIAAHKCAIASVNKGLSVSQARAYDCSKSCCVHLPTLPPPPPPLHLPQQPQLLSNSGRSDYHSKGQRSMSSGKAIDIIAWYVTFKQLASFPLI